MSWLKKNKILILLCRNTTKSPYSTNLVKNYFAKCFTWIDWSVPENDFEIVWESACFYELIKLSINIIADFDQIQVLLKFEYSEKATKLKKNLPHKIWRSWVASNFKWTIFSNFVAFSEYPNFTLNQTGGNSLWTLVKPWKDMCPKK